MLPTMDEGCISSGSEWDIGASGRGDGRVWQVGLPRVIAIWLRTVRVGDDAQGRGGDEVGYG